MNDDHYFLANAYLDGELTDEERRVAQDDPDVMSEVDRLRALQSALRAVDPTSPATRAAAIAAAMEVFETGLAEPISSRAPSRAPSRASERRVVAPLARKQPAYTRYLGIAAGLLAIGAIGIVAAGALGGSDNDSAGQSTEDAITTDTFAQITIAADSASREASATTAAADAPQDEMADVGMAESAPAEGSTAATTAAADAQSDSAGDLATTTMSAEQATAYPTTGGPIEPIADRNQTIATPGQLAGLGVLLADLRDAGELGATPETRCIFDDPAIEIVDTARYQFGDATAPVIVALVDDGIEGHTLAIDPDTCDIVIVGP